MNPIYDGRSGRSLFEMSNVLSFFKFMMFEESFLILLSLRISTVRLGDRSKSSNYVNLLKDKARISSFYDQGDSVKELSLFSLSSRTTKLLVWEKDPFYILSIEFLFNVKVYSFEQAWKVIDLIYEMLFEEASTFLNPYPKRGSPLILLSLIMRCSRVLIVDKFGRLVMLF